MNVLVDEWPASNLQLPPISGKVKLGKVLRYSLCAADGPANLVVSPVWAEPGDTPLHRPVHDMYCRSYAFADEVDENG